MAEGTIAQEAADTQEAAEEAAVRPPGTAEEAPSKPTAHVDTFLKYTALFVLISVVAFVFILGVFRISDPDVPWHIKSGEVIVKTLSIPKVDPFSWTRKGTPWAMTEWLFEAVLYLGYVQLGANGLILAKALFYTTVFVLLFNLLVHRSSAPGLSAALIALGAYLARGRLIERPQGVTYLFLVVLLIILLWEKKKASAPGASGRADQQDRRFFAGAPYLWVIPALVVVWVNMHPGAVFGLLMLLCFLTGTAIERWRDRSPEAQQSWYTDLTVQRLAIVTLASALAYLVNPQGLGIIVWTMRHLTPPVALIFENMPLSFSRFPIHTAYLIAVGILIVITARRVPPTAVLLAALFGYLALRANRNLVEFTIVTMPFVVVVLADLGRRAKDWFDAHWVGGADVSWGIVAGRIVLGLVILYMLWPLTISRSEYAFYGFGTGLNPKLYYPSGAIKFLDKNDINGRMYNSYGFGGYLIWKAPDRPVFLDGREPIYKSLVAETKNALKDQKTWTKFLDKYRIDYAVESSQGGAYFALKYDPKKWALVYWDDTSMVMLRRGPAFARVIRSYEYKKAFPYLGTGYAASVEKGSARAVEVELMRDIKDSPRIVSTQARLLLAELYLVYGKTDRGRSLLHEVMDMDSDMPEIKLVLGLNLLRRGAQLDAIEQFREL